jgi:uncharacterized protein (DUF433 family)
MVADTRELLGIGIYTPAEAAFFARVPTQTMSRWIFGDGRGKAVVQRQVTEEKVVTFLDFVQALAIRIITSLHHVPLVKIREAHDEAVSKYDITYPFARPNKTYLFGDRTILIRRNDDDYRPLTGDSKGNKMLTKIVTPFTRNLIYEQDIAVRFRAWQESGREIWMDPKKRFGEPIMSSCGYSAKALWEAYQTEGGAEAAASAYGVATEDVEVACSYYDHLVGLSRERETSL